ESRAGSGKSAILLRLALELSRLGIPVFYFKGEERLSPGAAAECITRLRDHGVVIVDSIAEHADQVAQLAERLASTKAKLVVVGAERPREARIARIRLAQFAPQPYQVTRVSGDEAAELIARLRKEGLLGRHARQSDAALQGRIRNTDLIVAMCEV